MIDFIAFLGQLYPCKVCRLNLQQELRYLQMASLSTAMGSFNSPEEPKVIGGAYCERRNRFTY